MSEKDLVLYCQKWDLDKFSVLYERYFDQIYKFVLLKTCDKSLAQDIVSETFFKALNKIDTFRYKHENSFKSWIYRIAYNLIIDDYKEQKRKINLEEITETCYNFDFAKDLDNKNKIQEIYNFFDTLKPKHKQILIMRFWDDLTYKEISELTWESVDNCKKIVSRSLAKIPENLIFILFIFLIF